MVRPEPPLSENVYGWVPPEAATLAVYGDPIAPFGSAAVVICSGAGFTISCTLFVTLNWAASVAVMATANVPGVSGVPLMEPLANVRPDGNPVTENEKGAVPPAALTATGAYATPTVPAGSEVGETVRAVPVIVSGNRTLSPLPNRSLTMRLTWNVPPC